MSEVSGSLSALDNEEMNSKEMSGKYLNSLVIIQYAFIYEYEVVFNGTDINVWV